jgi:cytoskeletal protein RodZ
MTNEEKPYPSRLKKKKNRSNSILNIMIGLVFALILIIGVSMLFSGGNDQAQDPEAVTISPETEDQTSGAGDSEDGSAGTEEEPEEDTEAADEEKEAAKKAEEEKAKKAAAEKKS